jgi:hypothetical protein
MFFKRNRKDESEIKKEKLTLLVKRLNSYGYYILDHENAIVVFKNKADDNYKMVHVRFIEDSLNEINSWYIKQYYLGFSNSYVNLKKLNLFEVQNGCGNFDSLYDYKNDRFIIPQNEWYSINLNYLDKYDGILGVFGIHSDYNEDDEYSYRNSVTGEIMEATFSVSDGDYYGMINLDGSIRGNKLFKGSSFSKIEEIIDLDKYESLEQFKAERKKYCNELKAKQKQAYYEMLSERNYDSFSPYLDSEVKRIIELKK